MATKQETIESDDDDEIAAVPVVPMLKTNSNEIPLILAPSQNEIDSNPWLTSTSSVVLPSSEYSKPDEIRNDEESSSDDDEEIQTQSTDQIEEENLQISSTERITEKNLQMPTISKTSNSNEKSTLDDQQHRMNIQEAFADDDVLAEFEKEKVKSMNSPNEFHLKILDGNR